MVAVSGIWLLCLSLARLSQTTAATALKHGTLVSRSDSSLFQSRAIYPKGVKLNSTSEDATLAEALKLVQEASKQQGDYNAHRVANPKCNEEVSKAWHPWGPTAHGPSFET